MTTPTVVDISSLITQTPGVYGGRPRLAGTRFPILQVAACYLDGMTAGEIAHEYGPLDLAAVHAGIAYYLANRVAIDAELDENTRFGEELARQAQAWDPFNQPLPPVPQRVSASTWIRTQAISRCPQL